VPLQVISQHTQEHVAADAPVQLVVDRTHFELHGFDLPKGRVASATMRARLRPPG